MDWDGSRTVRGALVGLVLFGTGCQVSGLIGSNATSVDEASESSLGAGGNDGTGTSGGETKGASGGSNDVTSTAVESASGTASGGMTSGALFDVGHAGEGAVECAPPWLAACDAEDATWFQALGLGCEDDGNSSFSSAGDPDAMLTLRGGLGAGSFVPRGGESMVILSTGRALDFPMTPEALATLYPEACGDSEQCPSGVLNDSRLAALPEPLDPTAVDDRSGCVHDPELVGQGDCSNSLQEHWDRGFGAYDYVELRIRTTVPANTDAFQYDFAFFSSEYPLYTKQRGFAEYNDMYVAWLNSESWTGNISFDEEGNPITVHSVFLDFRSASDQCPQCDAPELNGFSMENHAGTKWLTTKAPVVAGEEIELVLALFDLTDPILDSVVVLDNFQWTCADGPPKTWEG